MWEVPSSSSPVTSGFGNEGSYTQHSNYSFPFRDISEFSSLIISLSVVISYEWVRVINRIGAEADSCLWVPKYLVYFIEEILYHASCRFCPAFSDLMLQIFRSLEHSHSPFITRSQLKPLLRSGERCELITWWIRFHRRNHQNRPCLPRE